MGTVTSPRRPACTSSTRAPPAPPASRRRAPSRTTDRRGRGGARRATRRRRPPSRQIARTVSYVTPRRPHRATALPRFARRVPGGRRARQVGRCYKDRRSVGKRPPASGLSHGGLRCRAPTLTSSVTAITMRLRVTYHLACSRRLAAPRARDIAIEQTVELPAAAVSPEVAARVAGRVESVDSLGRGRSRAIISFDPEAVCGDLPQLLNLLFGNISFKSGTLIADLEWPEQLLAALRGPRLGIAGLRELTGV